MAEERDSVERRPARETARMVVGALLLAAVIAVGLDNRRDTSIGYVFGDVTAPLIVVLLVAAVLGAAIGWLLLHRLRQRD